MNDDELIQAALAAREYAYAPYSNYSVGCALRVADGSVYTDANVENASYGLCVCAERTAIVKAISEGHRVIVSVAVATQNSSPAAPCGMCRQSIYEFASDPAKVGIALVNPAGEITNTTLADLLPNGFRGGQLE